MILSILGGSANPLLAFHRPEIHVLLFGDPGLGKSALLGYIAGLVDRSVLVSASTSSTGGLSAIVHQDASSGGEYSIEAGALVLADQGLCLLDELDKTTGSIASLMDVMDNQSIFVAKAGIVCSLSARCTVIAAANPSGGQLKY